MLRVPVRWQMAAPATLLAFVLGSSWICYRAISARRQAVAESAAARRIPATFTALAPRARSLSEPIPASGEFRDAALFHGRLYLCGPGGLYAYDPGGALVEIYRSGYELPPGELVAVASERGQNGAELFIATTDAGILIFNGSQFRQLLPADAGARSFTAILGLAAGRILFGTTNHGVLAWDGKTLSEFLPALNRAHVTALAGSDSDIWIGTLAVGAYRRHAGQLDHFLTDLPDPRVLSISVSGASAFVGTALGVVEFRDGRKARGLAQGYFARSLDADAETLAVGTEDEGVVTVPLQSGRRIAESSEIAAELKRPVERILRLDGVRYALAGGLYRHDDTGRGWRSVLRPQPGALADRNIAALSVGHDGRVWIGYFDRGLDVADASFENVRHLENDHLFCVNRIVEDRAGSRTAIATANGLVMLDPALVIRQVLGRKDGLLADHVTDVLFRRDGLVIATPAGLSIADAGGIRSLYVLEGLVNNHVYTLAGAGDQIAAGTLGGLSLLDHNAVKTNYTTANSALRHNWISALARVGDEWFAGTYGAGVMRLDASGEWRGFADLKGGFNVNPNAMAQSHDFVYAGSLGQGLLVYSKSNGRWTRVTSGLPSLNVTAVAAANGYVYAGTDNGLARFREGEFE